VSITNVGSIFAPASLQFHSASHSGSTDNATLDEDEVINFEEG
jgi:hypothetical protein